MPGIFYFNKIICSLKYKGQGYKYADFKSVLKKQYGYPLLTAPFFRQQ